MAIFGDLILVNVQASAIEHDFERYKFESCWSRATPLWRRCRTSNLKQKRKQIMLI